MCVCVEDERLEKFSRHNARFALGADAVSVLCTL